MLHVNESLLINSMYNSMSYKLKRANNFAFLFFSSNNRLCWKRQFKYSTPSKKQSFRIMCLLVLLQVSKSLIPELQQRHLKSCNLLFDFFKVYLKIIFSLAIWSVHFAILKTTQ